jgi:hypothetical protein
MNYRSRRHGWYCERPRWECNSYRPIDRCDPPISWPQRPSNFPAISISWPVPMVVPLMPWLGAWGTVRWSAERPFYADRRPLMDRERYCEPDYRRYERCCERCGCYPCRCERCDRCGYYDCHCERCAKCGYRECRCGEDYGSRRIKIRVDAPDNNCTAEISQEWFDSNALPTVGPFGPPGPTTPTGHVHISPGVIKILIKVPSQSAPQPGAPPVIYRARLVDLQQNSKFLANLTVTIY